MGDSMRSRASDLIGGNGIVVQEAVACGISQSGDRGSILKACWCQPDVTAIIGSREAGREVVHFGRSEVMCSGLVMRPGIEAGKLSRIER